jgi:pimeloyl-ACP methyl ester carboxylesterase
MFYMNGNFTSLAQMRWAWSHILAFDSLPALGQVTCPVLGLFGQGDVLTDAAEASNAMRLGAAGNPDVTALIIPGASHSLMQTPARTGMAPGVFDTLRQWLPARL